MSVLLVSPVAHAEIVVGTRTISHGVKAWYTQNDTVPVVDVELSFEGAGYASDPSGRAGRAAFAAAMMTEGAGTLDSVNFKRALEEKAIQLSISTEEDRLRIHLYCLREHAARAGELLALALSQPQLVDADQARVKADLAMQLSLMEERPVYHAQRLLLKRMFAGHPYSSPPYGDATSIAALTGEDVREYVRTYVTRGNVLIAASGDVDASVLDAMLEPVVDALAGNDSGAVAVTQTSIQGAGETLREKMDVPQTSILFAAPMIAREDPRFYAAYLLNHILGGSGLFSRLSEEVRQQKGLAYSVSTDIDIKRGASLLTGALATRNATAEEAIAQVKSVFEAMHDRGVSTQECEDAKSDVIGSYARRLDSTNSISETLLSMQIYKLGQDYINEREALFKKVSCADINAMATEVLNPSRFVFSVVGGTPEAGAAASAPVAAPAIHNDVR